MISSDRPKQGQKVNNIICAREKIDVNIKILYGIKLDENEKSWMEGSSVS